MTEQKEKIYIYAVIAFVCCIVIGVIVVIWMPDNTSKSKLNSINVTKSYEEVQNEHYTDVVNELLLIKNYDKLYEKVDKEWMESNELDKESLYNWLFENLIISNNKPEILSIDDIEDNENFYYRIKIIDINNKVKYVIINEVEPNNFTISFEQDSIKKMSGKKYEYSIGQAVYKVTVLNVMDNIIQYQIDVTNNDTEALYFNLNNNDTISLELSTGEKIYASDITTYAVNEYEISSGGSFSIKAVFNLSLEKQNNIEAINFNNVFDKDGKTTIKVNLKESVE